jgi:hypothetical protein
MNLFKLPDTAKVSGADFNRLVDAIRQSTRFAAGPGMHIHRSSLGTLVSLDRYPLSTTAGTQGSGSSSWDYEFLGAIVSVDSTLSEPSSHQWVYNFVEVMPGGSEDESDTYGTDGYGVFHKIDGGESGVARNLLEIINSATGTQGNGIDINASFPAGFDMQPAPVGVVLKVMRFVDSSAGPYWFEYSNAIDGLCA